MEPMVKNKIIIKVGFCAQKKLSGQNNFKY